MIPETKHEPELITALRDAAILLQDLSCTGNDLDEGTAQALLSHRLTDGMSHLMDLAHAIPEPAFTEAAARLNTVWMNGNVTMNLRFEDLSLLLRAVPAIKALLGRET